MMETYLNSPIKEVITKFPKVADILNEYNIGCVPCNVGSCLLKDVVEIHNLSLENERALMERIVKVIYPGKKVEIPKIHRKVKPGSGELKYSPPMKALVDEHLLIKRWIALIPEVIENMNLGSEEWRALISDGVDFIRSYADKYHHAKEEEILFKFFDENLDIIKTMLEDHKTGREHVKALLEGLDKEDAKAVAEHLKGYGELLTEHIKKEDEILYPWMDRNLTTTQIGELFSKFNEANEKSGKGVKAKYEKFIETVEKLTKKPETGNQ